MKQTTMCVLSGFFGALFAVACGVVDGIGDKEANASDVLLVKHVVSGTCNFNINEGSPVLEYPSDYEDAWDDIQQNNAVWNLLEMCICFDSDNDLECDDGFSDTFKLAYIK
jgi:hypothetical protein